MYQNFRETLKMEAADSSRTLIPVQQTFVCQQIILTEQPPLVGEVFFFFFFWVVRLSALRPRQADCARLGG
jgi:hypothetical protein